MANDVVIIHTPHDKLFRTAMANKKVATEFLKSKLPAEILKESNFETLHLCDNTFISKDLSLTLSDLLFRLEIKGEIAYIYILIEHQSTVRKLMPLRLLQLSLGAIESHVKQYESDTLPLIYPLVFYHGRDNHPAPTDFFSLFGDQSDLARKVWNEPYSLVDMRKIPDSELEPLLWVGPLMYIVKHIFDPDILPAIPKIRAQVNLLIEAGECDYGHVLLYYQLVAGFKISQTGRTFFF